MLAGPALAQLGGAPPPGAAQTFGRTVERERYQVPVGRYGPDRPDALTVEGRVVRRAYRVEGPEASVEGVIGHFHDRLSAQGYETLFRCRQRSCGGFDFRFAIELLPAPAMLMDTAHFAQLSMAAPDGRWASVLASRVMDAVHVQTVFVEGEAITAPSPEPRPIPAGPDDAPEDAQPAPIEAVISRRRDAERAAEDDPAVDGAEVAAEAGEPVAPAEQAERPDEDADGLAETLVREGHAVLEGVSFEAGGATLSPGSGAVLDRAVAALGPADGLRLAVVGHSDATGALGPNISLSERRAEAVRRELVERGIPADRLQAHGAGWLAPRAPNDTEAGRARNRRVELVVLP